MTTALFIGRFQPFHNTHLEVVKDILKENDKVIIAIGSSQENSTKENPFSYEERKHMIKETVMQNKIKNFEIVELPDFFDDEKWTDYIKKKIPKFDVAYSGNPVTINCFGKSGIRVKKIKLIEGVNGTKIRERMFVGSDWKKFVPKQISSFIEKSNGVERIRKL